jgi:hypothetical protein
MVLAWGEAGIPKPNNRQNLNLFFLPSPKFVIRLIFQARKKAVKTLESSTSWIENPEINPTKYN